MPPDLSPEILFVRVDGGAPEHFDFTVNTQSALLAEHFPGFPVAPGSQVLDFLWRETSEDKLAAAGGWVDVLDAKFQRPIVTGVRFTCTSLATAGDAPRRRIQVTDAAGRPCLQATLMQSRPRAPDAPIPSS